MGIAIPKMASKEFNVMGILHPKKGKTDIVLRQLNEVAEYVQKNEPGVLSYSINRSLRPSKDGEEEIIMLERYVQGPGSLERTRIQPDIHGIQQEARGAGSDAGAYGFEDGWGAGWL